MFDQDCTTNTKHMFELVYLFMTTIKINDSLNWRRTSVLSKKLTHNLFLLTLFTVIYSLKRQFKYCKNLKLNTFSDLREFKIGVTLQSSSLSKTKHSLYCLTQWHIFLKMLELGKYRLLLSMEDRFCLSANYGWLFLNHSALNHLLLTC